MNLEAIELPINDSENVECNYCENYFERICILSYDNRKICPKCLLEKGKEDLEGYYEKLNL